MFELASHPYLRNLGRKHTPRVTHTALSVRSLVERDPRVKDMSRCRSADRNCFLSKIMAESYLQTVGTSGLRKLTGANFKLFAAPNIY